MSDILMRPVVWLQVAVHELRSARMARRRPSTQFCSASSRHHHRAVLPAERARGLSRTRPAASRTLRTRSRKAAARPHGVRAGQPVVWAGAHTLLCRRNARRAPAPSSCRTSSLPLVAAAELQARVGYAVTQAKATSAASASATSSATPTFQMPITTATHRTATANISFSFPYPRGPNRTSLSVWVHTKTSHCRLASAERARSHAACVVRALSAPQAAADHVLLVSGYRYAVRTAATIQNSTHNPTRPMRPSSTDRRARFTMDVSVSDRHQVRDHGRSDGRVQQ